MKIRISDRYSINFKKMHPAIKLLLTPIVATIVAIGLAGIVGLVLFLAWFVWALLKL